MLAHIITLLAQIDQGEVTRAINVDNIPKVNANPATIDGFLNVVFMAAGAISVLFIVIGGLRYVLSGGDPNNTNQAKNTILYAVIGLVISFSAFLIVNFVIGQIEQ